MVLEIERQLVAVKLFGTPEVADAAQRLYDSIGEKAAQSSGEAAKAFLAHYERVVSAMRADTEATLAWGRTHATP